MRIWKPLALVSIVAVVAIVTGVPMLRKTAIANARSVVPLSADEFTSLPKFDREHSAALFVGVKQFADGTPQVPYAVDDAIDLAHVFALDKRVQLVDAPRVVLALSGEPVKPESQRRLRELREAGARVVAADRILPLIEEQATRAGKRGRLIVSFATHGFERGGIPFVLGASADAMSTAKMIDVIEEHEVPQSLILVDACRTRVTGGGRGAPGTGTGSGAIAHRTHIRGMAMLSAVGDAYDDPLRRNGVFTSAVLDGLDCKASTPRCCVTPETLAPFVERNVHQWITRNHKHHAGSALQYVIDGEARTMPLARCWVEKLSLQLVHESSILTAIKDARRIWSRDVGAPIVGSGIADLAAVVATPSALIAFDGDGKEVWKTPAHFDAIATADLFHKHQDQIVALSGSRLSILSSRGHVLSTYEHRSQLDHLAICRPTSRHDPRIVVTSGSSVLAFKPKKIGKPVWSGHVVPSSDAIRRIEVADYDRDTKSDIAITTESGRRLILDFNGKVIHQADGITFRRDRRPRSSSLRRGRRSAG